MLTQVDYTQPIEYYTEPIQHAPIVLKSFVMINSFCWEVCRQCIDKQPR